jgi:hypothetical protein
MNRREQLILKSHYERKVDTKREELEIKLKNLIEERDFAIRNIKNTQVELDVVNNGIDWDLMAETREEVNIHFNK